MRVLSVMTVLSSLLLAIAGGCGAAPSSAKSGPGAPVAVPVTVAVAAVADVPRTVRAIGQLQASQLVVVRPQVSGPLRAALFRAGEVVSAGQPLFSIDPRPSEQALLQARAAHERSLAGVRQAQAVLARDRALVSRAKTEAERSASLVTSGMVTPSADEQTQVTYQAAQEVVVADEASIAAAQATVAVDAAAIEQATLQVGYCQVQAPIAGRTGAWASDPGNVVIANQTELVTITQAQPIHASFTIPEALLADVRAAQAANTLQVALSQAGEAGRVDLIDNQIDHTTGTIRLRAVLANAAGTLWPGQFVEVILTIGVDANVVVVPLEAVQNGQQGRFVYVIGSGAAANTVVLRPVQVLRSVAGQALLSDGVKAGDQVVTDGQVKLTPGATVAIQP